MPATPHQRRHSTARRRSLVAGVGVGVAILAAAVALAGCAASEPPPRSPFEDTATVAPDAGTPRPLPTFPAAPGGATPDTSTPGPTPAPDAEARQERVVGEAISRLAEWVGVAQTSISVITVEAVDWPSACIGVEIPGFACAEVITPGYRMMFAIDGDQNGPQQVNASTGGRYVWAPTFFGQSRPIEDVDLASGVITLATQPERGGDPQGTRHRVLPGSYLEVALGDLHPGDLVDLGTTYHLSGQDTGAIVWLVPASE